MTNSGEQKKRLDLLLVEQKLAPTRSKARDLIKDGYVEVDGEVVKKPGDLWAPAARIRISEEAPHYVARSAQKLAHALSLFDVDVKDKCALDIGASTGGFTEVLLEQGARHVYALDVGHDQLHENLQRNPRVINLEGRDARSLTSNDFKEPPGIITADLSFISLTKAIKVPLELAAPGAWVIALIKPQFEVTKADLNKKGVVMNEATRLAAVKRVQKWFASQPGWHIIGTSPSPIKGHAGNQEYLICVGHEEF